MDNILTQQTEKWTASRKIAFRLIAVYIVLYIFPFPLNFITEDAWQSFGSLFDPFVNWVAHHMLHFRQEVHVDNQNGSGDTSYYYVQVFIFMMLTVIVGMIWSVIDRKRDNYTKLLYWAKVYVRYYLAFFLMVYGFSKFNHGQFPSPDLNRLLQPYGKSSPMGLAWTFLGFSQAFGVFMGISECAGGLFMLFRRTTLFGACIATTVVTNIVMINFCYDVPVKIFSAHLLLLCLFVLFSEGSRFLNLFILNKPVQPLDLSPVFQNRKMRITRIVVKVIITLGIVGMPLVSVIQESAGNDDVKPLLYGAYTVKTFIRNSEIIPPLTTDSTRWNKFIIQWVGSSTIQRMTEKANYYSFKPDTVNKTVTISSFSGPKTEYKLCYKKEDSTLCLYGRFESDSVYIEMQRYNEKKFLLTSRGFHWINEHPFNR